MLVSGKIPEKSDSILFETVKKLRPHLDLKKGPWIAGGSVRRIISNIPNGGDIDIFFHKDNPLNTDQIIDIRNTLGLVDSKLGIERLLKIQRLKAQDDTNIDGVEDIYVNTELKVQLICFETYDSVEELLQSFDYTVCMAATDGDTWIADERMFSDHDAKLIRHHNESKEYKSQISRLNKYCYTHGFNPVPGVLARVLSVYNEDIFLSNLNDDLTLLKKEKEYIHDT